jgi:glyoxylase-like metal-dependent hydrolase (beta-lactamase superfamily II)
LQHANVINVAFKKEASLTIQLPLTERARASESVDEAKVREVASDIAYFRALMVNVAFVGPRGAPDRGWVLIDTGVMGTSEAILGAIRSRFGTARPAAIVQTHGHFDHVGALEAFGREWDVPIYAHRLEEPYLTGKQSYPPPDAGADGGIMPKLSPLFPRGPIDVSDRLQLLPDDGTVPPLEGWRWVHTPGHTPGHVSLWRDADKSLIAGDAVITTGQESAYDVATQEFELHGPPRYFTPDWQASRESVRTLAGLQPNLLVTGHGRAAAGAEMRRALETLARDFDAIAPPSAFARDGSTGTNGRAWT